MYIISLYLQVYLVIYFFNCLLSIIQHNGNTWSLYITLPGNYTLQSFRTCVNRGLLVFYLTKMSLTLSILVFISVPPNVTLQNKYYVGREKSVSLDCKVDGYPPPTITWTPCNVHENVCDQSKLNISKVQNDGVYTCTVKNSLGNDSTNTSVGKSFLFHVCQLSVHKMIASFRIDTIFFPPIDGRITP